MLRGGGSRRGGFRTLVANTGKVGKMGKQGSKRNEEVSDLFVEIDAGDYLFREGTSASAVFFVEDGEIEIIKNVGRERIHLSTLGPGSFLGEATLESRAHAVSARAVCASRLLRIGNGVLEKVLVRKPHIAVAVLLDFAGRIRGLYDVVAPGIAAASSKDDSDSK